MNNAKLLLGFYRVHSDDLNMWTIQSAVSRMEHQVHTCMGPRADRNTD